MSAWLHAQLLLRLDLRPAASTGPCLIGAKRRGDFVTKVADHAFAGRGLMSAEQDDKIEATPRHRPLLVQGVQVESSRVVYGSLVSVSLPTQATATR